MDKMIYIFHNSRCSKSRGALQYVQEFTRENPEFDYEEIPYLENPPSAEKLIEICQQLHIRPWQLIRSGETLFKELGFVKTDLEKYSDEFWLEVLVTHSKLMERPIVQFQKQAVIGRPPERVFEFLVHLKNI